MPTVTRTRPVKNLGWLLAHSQECTYITLTRDNDNPNTPCGAQLDAEGYDTNDNHWTFSTRFASSHVARHFAQRRTFDHTIREYRTKRDATRG